MAVYRVTITGDVWVERSGHVLFPCVIEYERGTDTWVGVRGATNVLRVPVAEAKGAMDGPNPLQALGALLVQYAQQDEAVVGDSKIAGYRDRLPGWPVTLGFDLG